MALLDISHRVVASGSALVVLPNAMASVLASRKEKEMKLKDVTKNIQGDFYIALPHKGVIKDQGVGGYCEIHTYNSEEVLGGKDSLPSA